MFEAEESEVKDEILSAGGGFEYEEMFDRSEDEVALNPLNTLSQEELNNLQPHVDMTQDSVTEDLTLTPNPQPATEPKTCNVSSESAAKDGPAHLEDAEARFGRYLAEKMRMVPKERQFDAEFAVLGALREFIPR